MYTINGKDYTEFEINKRCAEILAWESEPNVKSVKFDSGCFLVHSVGYTAFKIEDYCNNPSDTWPIIEKVWDELMSVFDSKGCNPRFYVSGKNCTKWEYLMDEHNCSKLKAAAICLIECNGGE